MDWIEREELELERAYERGEMTLKEYNHAMLELQRDARDAAAEDRARRIDAINEER